jgi:hypothetical protein
MGWHPGNVQQVRLSRCQVDLRNRKPGEQGSEGARGTSRRTLTGMKGQCAAETGRAGDAERGGVEGKAGKRREGHRHEGGVYLDSKLIDLAGLREPLANDAGRNVTHL